MFSQENVQDDRAIVENGTPAYQNNTQNGSSTSTQNTGSSVRVKPKKPGRKVFSASLNAPYVALTFDDGPHPVHTPRILNILNKYGAKATFYVLGERVQRHPSIVARAIAGGHEIGVHTWDHPSLTGISREEVKSQMDRSLAAIASATSRKIRTMRPPYGAVNKGLVDFFASEYGMSTIMWNVDTNDWRRPGVSVVTSRAVDAAKSGSIILLHDIHGPSADAVEGIVKGLQARGFKIVTVSELLYRAYLESKQEQQMAQAPSVTVQSPAVEDVLVHKPTVLPEFDSAPVAPLESTSPQHSAGALTEPSVPAAPTPVMYSPDVVAPGMQGSF